MSSVRAVRASLAAALTGQASIVEALNGQDYQVNLYPVSSPTPPTIEITQFGQTKHVAMGDGAEWWTCLVRAYVALVADDNSLELADGFLEDDPVAALLEADGSLIVDRADQRFWDHPGSGSVLAGVEWQVRLLLDPSQFVS